MTPCLDYGPSNHPPHRRKLSGVSTTKPTPYYRAFGAAVRTRRETLTLSQEELCARSELDRTYISGVERGVRNPTLKTMLKISGALKIKLDELMASTQQIFESRR